MRIPEKLFVVINTIVRVTLRSPLHRLMSDSFMVINHVGRKSGKPFATPVRYMPIENGVRAFTAEHTQWWRNVSATPTVTLLVAGTTGNYTAQVRARDAAVNRDLLIEFLTIFPQDATYQDIRLNQDGSLNEDDLAVAAGKSIIVDFTQ